VLTGTQEKKSTSKQKNKRCPNREMGKKGPGGGGEGHGKASSRWPVQGERRRLSKNKKIGKKRGGGRRKSPSGTEKSTVTMGPGEGAGRHSFQQHHALAKER